jgi:hypothetical protein
MFPLKMPSKADADASNISKQSFNFFLGVQETPVQSKKLGATTKRDSGNYLLAHLQLQAATTPFSRQGRVGPEG